MNDKTRLGLRTLEAALALGLLGDWLFMRAQIGLNLLLWIAALLACIFALRRARGVALTADARNFALWATLFAVASVARASPVLKNLDALAILVAVSLLVWHTATGARARVAGIFDFIGASLRLLSGAMFGMLPLLVRDVEWKSVSKPGWSRHALAIARGVVIACPVLLVFGVLLCAADAIFAQTLANIFQFNVEELAAHTFLFLLIAWVSGGVLHGMFFDLQTQTAANNLSFTNAKADTSNALDILKATTLTASPAHAHADFVRPPRSVTSDTGELMNEPPRQSVTVTHAEDDTSASAPSSRATTFAPVPTSDSRASNERTAASVHTRGTIEMCVVLGSVNLLFLGFVAVQFGYFFGGAAHLAAHGLTFSEYARRGFFELVAVVALVLPLLLLADYSMRDKTMRERNIFRALAGVQLCLLSAIMLSAVSRMRLYQLEYGLTELRVYTTAFMVWLACAAACFAWTTLLRARRERFAHVALTAGFIIIVALHFINPDALIVRANFSRVAAHKDFDAAYATSLSADAVPPLVEALPQMNAQDRAFVITRLRTSIAEGRSDWRGWNLAEYRARRAVEPYLIEFRQPPTPDEKISDSAQNLSGKD